jgi:RNA polymerase subunit RPABC4/transcription elongation factor Spt4
MALKPCRECGAQVSTSAEVCPHCGVRAPASKDPLAVLTPQKSSTGASTQGWSGAVVAMLALIFGIAILWPKSETVPSQGTCKTDWTKCVSNAELVNTYSDWSRVQAACKSAANERVKYGTPVWPWLAFGSFRAGNNFVTTGSAIAIEPDAQFQNGFGAMVHSQVICFYDLKARRVTDISMQTR